MYKNQWRYSPTFANLNATYHIKMIIILDQLRHDIYEFSDLITRINIIKLCQATMQNHKYEYDVFRVISRMQRKYLFKACDRGQVDLIWQLTCGEDTHYAVKIACAWFPKIVSIQLRKNLVPFPGHSYGMPGPVYMQQKYMDSANYILNMHTYFAFKDDRCEYEQVDNFGEHIDKYLADLCDVSKNITSPFRVSKLSKYSENINGDEYVNQIWPQVYDIVLVENSSPYGSVKLFVNAIKYLDPRTALIICTEDMPDIYAFISRGEFFLRTYTTIHTIDPRTMFSFMYSKCIGFNKHILSEYLCMFENPEINKLHADVFGKWSTKEIIKNIKNEDQVKMLCANTYRIRKDYIDKLSQAECERLFIYSNNITSAMKLYNAGKISTRLVRIKYERCPKERYYWGPFLDTIVCPSETRKRKMSPWSKWYPNNVSTRYVMLSKRQYTQQRDLRMNKKYGRKMLRRKARTNINDHMYDEEDIKDDNMDDAYMSC